MKKLYFLLLAIAVGCSISAQTFLYQNDFSAEPTHFTKTANDSTYKLTLSNGILNIALKNKAYNSVDSLYLNLPTLLDLTFNPKIYLTAKSDSNVMIMLYLVDKNGAEVMSSNMIKKSISDTSVVFDYTPMLIYFNKFNIKQVAKVRFDIIKSDYTPLIGNFKLNNITIGGAMSDSCTLLKKIKIGTDSVHDFNPFFNYYNEDFIGTTLPEVVAVPYDSRATVTYEIKNELNDKSVTINVTPYVGAKTSKYIVLLLKMARLSSLLLNGKLITGFDSRVINYTCNLSTETTIPTVTATLVDPLSSLTVTQASGIHKYASVVVSSSDNSVNNTYSVYFEKIDSIATPEFPSTLYKTGNTVYVPILTSYLSEIQAYKFYQFELKYDPTILSYIDYDLTSTLSKGSTISVNSSTLGLLTVSCSTVNALVGVGELLRFQFKAIKTGESLIDIANFRYNEVPVLNIKTFPIKISDVMHGDVDNNAAVQAYDAALVLQASVGINPFPNQDLLKILEFLLQVGDVDNDTLITSNDASLILRYSAQIIKAFPTPLKSKAIGSEARLEAIYSNNKIIIKSLGGVYAVNATVPLSAGSVGIPHFNKGVSAYNQTEKGLAMGLITTSPFENGMELISLDVVPSSCSSFTIDCNVNGVSQTLVVKQALANNTNAVVRLKSYPNPVQNTFTIEGNQLNDKTEVELFSADGQKHDIQFSQVNKRIVLTTSYLASGVYLVVMKQQDGTSSTVRFVKK